MKRNWRTRVYTAAVVLPSILVSGCTALEEGFRDGISSGLSAALAALIEAPVTLVLDQVLGGG